MYNNEYKRKAELSQKAGDALSKLYKDSAMHCYYYACLQYCKHILKDKFNVGDNEIISYANSKNIRGSHESLMALLNDKMLQKNIDRTIQREIISKLKMLKGWRTTSDYKLIFANETIIKHAKSNLRFIIENLSKLF